MERERDCPKKRRKREERVEREGGRGMVDSREERKREREGRRSF